MSIETRLAAQLAAGYGLHADQVCRIPLGTATDNFRVHTDGGQVFVKSFRTGTDLAYERAILAVIASASMAGIAVPTLMPDTRGELLHEGGGLAVAVWQWCDVDSLVGQITPDQAHTIGATLAKLHTHLRQFDDGSWPVAQPHYRRHTLNQIRQRFLMITRHIESLEHRTDLDEVNLERIAQRLKDLHHMPSLLAAATPPQRQVAHGDYVRPNWLIHNGQLRAVIDFRIKYDDPVREIGRMAFDVPTIGAGGDWLAVAQAALSGYLAQGGTVASSQFHGCARLAVLHSLCTTYPVEELYLDPPPAHIREDLNEYWANRNTTVREMLRNLDAIDDMVSRLTSTQRPTPSKPRTTLPAADLGLPVLAAVRAHLLAQIVDNAQAANVGALMLWGSGVSHTADPLSDVDIIVVADDPIEGLRGVLPQQLLEPAPLLFSRTVTGNGPHGGFYRGLCADVLGWPVWVDVYVWPASAAVVPADAAVLFDRLGLHDSPQTFWQLLDASRAEPDGNPFDEPGGDDLLRLLVAAKGHARGDHAGALRALRHSVPGVGMDAAASRALKAAAESDPAAQLLALLRWVGVCRALAQSGGLAAGWDTEILRQTTKSTVVRVTSPAETFIVKLLTSSDPYWAGIFANECRTYKQMAAAPSPARVPRMLHAGPGTLVLSEVGGVPLHTERYPRQPLNPDHVKAALEALSRFGAWQPGQVAMDRAESIRLHDKAAATLDLADARAYRLVRSLCRSWCLAHGDAVPSNVLIHPDGTCTLVDFEHTGVHLPGYDYALLRVLLTNQPDPVTTMVDDFAVRHAGTAAYTANLVAVAARERRLHTEFPGDPTGYREQIVERAWASALQRLRAHPAVQSPHTRETP